jgi:hypothetical protein
MPLGSTPHACNRVHLGSTSNACSRMLLGTTSHACTRRCPSAPHMNMYPCPYESLLVAVALNSYVESVILYTSLSLALTAFFFCIQSVAPLEVDRRVLPMFKAASFDGGIQCLWCCMHTCLTVTRLHLATLVTVAQYQSCPNSYKAQ